MTRIGSFPAGEEHGPRSLVHQARGAEAAGFDALCSSDHCHPWSESRGQAPFVWAVGRAAAALQLLPLPRRFAQLTREPVTEDMVAARVPCGPGSDVHMAAIRPYLQAGVDAIYLSRVGDDQEGFFEFCPTEILPRPGTER